MEFTEVNSRIKVIATFQPDADIGHSLTPHKMLWNSREITFTEFGLYHPTMAGKRMIHVFDMSDGGSDYRLEFDAERLRWTLISVTTCE